MTFEPINSKVVKASVSESAPLLSRRGAMLGYTGDVRFAPVTLGQGGVGGFLGRAVRGEQASMMSTQGNGEVFFGYLGLHQHVISLNNETLSVEADRLLVHDGSLTSATVFLGSQGGVRGAVRGAVSGQGLFTSELSGSGSVAVLAHGDVFEIPITSNSQIHVDPQAYVAHKGQVNVAISAKVGWREAVGRGSGEAFQLKLSGSGTVYVQASEEKL